MYRRVDRTKADDQWGRWGVILALMRLPITRWFNYIKLPSGWHTDARNLVVQGCQSGGALIHRRHLQRWHRAKNFNNSPRRHWRLHVHSTQWRRTSFSHGTRHNCGRRCYYGEFGRRNLNAINYPSDHRLMTWGEHEFSSHPSRDSEAKDIN